VGQPLERSLKPRSRIGGGIVQALAGDASVRPLDESIEPAVLAVIVLLAGAEVAIRWEPSRPYPTFGSATA